MGQRKVAINSCSFVENSLPLNTRLLHTIDSAIYGFGRIDTVVLVSYRLYHTGIVDFGRTGTVVTNRTGCWEVAESSRNPLNIL